MKKLLFSLALVAAPAAVVAQGAPPEPAPTRMGKWDEFGDRQQRQSEQRERHEGKGGDRAANLTATERRLIGYQFAECLVGKHQKLTQDYVLETVERDKVDDRFRMFSDFDCIPDYYKNELTRLRMGYIGGRFNFAEILLKVEQPAIPDNFIDVPFLEHLDPAKEMESNKTQKLSDKERAVALQRLTGEAAMSRIGECTVRGDLANSKALLATAIGTPEELAAVQNLVPAVSRCIQNGSVKILPEQLRGSIALNLYRLLAVKAALKKSEPDA
jgi:Ni/Co efflux regulator RcnB